LEKFKTQMNISLKKVKEPMVKINKLTNQSKILRSIIVEDFDTDESLKDIAFEDIKSDCNDDDFIDSKNDKDNEEKTKTKANTHDSEK
jgi:hypothetical protein